ncbi:MAG: hypothetical protein M3511_13340 [Deinococcota bacterium]|nr:hypothetical protein [Deinococcota bacterium]
MRDLTSHSEVTCSTDGSDAGELTHNHVFAVGPGDAEYNGHFQINLVVPGPNYPGEASADSYNSEETVLAGVEAGELIIDNDNVARVAWWFSFRNLVGGLSQRPV